MDSMETKYTDIIIYVCGFLALIMATIIVVLCRMQVQPRREPFDALPVQKLSKFPLRRQVGGAVCNQQTMANTSVVRSKPYFLFPSIRWSPTHQESPVHH